MARLSKRPSPGVDDDAFESRRTAAANRLTPSRTLQPPVESPSPAGSFSSDKENRAMDKTRISRDRSTATPTAASSALGARRSVLTDRTTPRSAARTRNAISDEARSESSDDESPSEQQPPPASVLDTHVYDPEQDISQRRDTRKTMRDLTRELLDSRSEFLASESTGLRESIQKANRYFETVKQTSDATLDSRFLVSAGDTAARRAVRMNFGGAARGIDVGEFAVKARAFMARGPRETDLAHLDASERAALTSTGSAATQFDADDPTQDDGDELNWGWLGLRACRPYSRRPATPDFLLGPLGVQKKNRVATQRGATQRSRALDPADATRPDELRAGDVERAENANLTALCRRIFRQLVRHQQDSQEALERWAAAQDDPDAIPEADLAAKLDSLALRPDGGVCLVRFAFDPASFGQTVENLFYISFLIRDGKAGLALAPDDLPSLHPTDASNPDDIVNGGPAPNKKAGRRQAVFHLDFQQWRDACDAFTVVEPIIGHRREDTHQFEVSATGWYG